MKEVELRVRRGFFALQSRREIFGWSGGIRRGIVGLKGTHNDMGTGDMRQQKHIA